MKQKVDTNADFVCVACNVMISSVHIMIPTIFHFPSVSLKINIEHLKIIRISITILKRNYSSVISNIQVVCVCGYIMSILNVEGIHTFPKMTL